MAAFGLLLVAPMTLLAQALLNPPPPAPSAFEQEIASIDSVDELTRRASVLTGTDELNNRAIVLARLVQLQPHVGRHRYELAVTFAQQEDRRRAYDVLLRMQGQGYAYDLATDKRFEKVADTKVWEYLEANFEANRRTFGKGSLAFEVPAGEALLESIAWDSRHGRWLFGSIRDGSIQARGNDGELVPFITASADNGLWSVMELKVDAERGKLWVVSAAMPLFAGLREEHLGLSGLFRFDLESGALEKRWLIPANEGANALTALALGRRGEVYALDGLTQTVYLADDEGMRPFFGSPNMRALRSLVVSEDGNRLYVADYDAGILVVDLARNQAFDLQGMATLTLDGIESLNVWKGHLLLVQSGTAPAMRIMRLRLSDDGLRVTNAMPIDANHEGMTLPVSGTIRDDALYFIANSRKSDFDQAEGGDDADEVQPVRVFRSDLTVAMDIVPEELQR